MKKPFSLMVQETKQELVDIINKSNLHPSIIELIVKDIYWEVNRLNIETLKKENEQFIKESDKNQTLFDEVN